MFGERLHIARKHAGLSLTALAERLAGAVDAREIRGYERGDRTPSSGVMLRLARVLGVEIGFFAAPTRARLTALDYRKRSRTTAQDRARVETAVLTQVERYLLIEDVLGLDSAHWAAPFPRRCVASLEEAERLAQETRAAWGLLDEPIPDLTELLEEKGVKVLLLPLPDAVSGLTCQVERRAAPPAPVIVVNRSHSLERRRLTLAHELAHRLLTADPRLEEKAATRFASAFLAPAAPLRREFGVHRHALGAPELMHIKRLFRLSAAALVVRLRDVGVIGEETARRIFMGVGKSWRRAEPQPLESGEDRLEQPRRFERLCFRALAEDDISLVKAAELLGRPVVEIEAAMIGQAADAADRHQ